MSIVSTVNMVIKATNNCIEFYATVVFEMLLSNKQNFYLRITTVSLFKRFNRFPILMET